MKTLFEKLKSLRIYAVICSFYPYLKIIVGLILAYLIIDATVDKNIVMMIIWWLSLLSLTFLKNYR